jgi:hypothetical protein
VESDIEVRNQAANSFRLILDDDVRVLVRAAQSATIRVGFLRAEAEQREWPGRRPLGPCLHDPDRAAAMITAFSHPQPWKETSTHSTRLLELR